MKMSGSAAGQAIGFLKRIVLGMPIKEACCPGGFFEAIFCMWRSGCGGMCVLERLRAWILKALASRQ